MRNLIFQVPGRNSGLQTQFVTNVVNKKSPGPCTPPFDRAHLVFFPRLCYYTGQVQVWPRLPSSGQFTLVFLGPLRLLYLVSPALWR